MKTYVILNGQVVPRIEVRGTFSVADLVGTDTVVNMHVYSEWLDGGRSKRGNKGRRRQAR